MASYKIIKRDGRLDDFNKQKILNAIKKAFLAVDGTLTKAGVKTARRIAKEIEEKVKITKEVYSVEQIQNIVEEKLMSSARKDVAKAYVLYRNERNVERVKGTKLMKSITEKLNASNIQNQNANVDEHSFGGRAGEARDELLKEYALNNLMSELSRNNHLNNEIYVHDLSSYALGDHNCLTIPFDDLLAKGFNTRQTDVRPANSINTAFQLVAVIFQLQSLQQFGGVSAGHLDWTMVPYVRKSFAKHFSKGVKYIYEEEISIEDNSKKYDVYPRKSFQDYMTGVSIDNEFYKKYPKAFAYAKEETERELKQAVEGMYHNLNTLQSRSGNQLPFTSINYGTCTLPEGRMVIKALLEGSLAGVGKVHKTAVFPCGIFQCMKGVNRKPGEPNYDLYKLALKSTAQRLYPNYANVDWSVNAGYDVHDPRTYVATMGKCKL